MGYRYSFWRFLPPRRCQCAPKRCWRRSGCVASAHLPAGELTYAEQRALELGITIAGGADVILLDEPPPA
jgi:branched-chain amino acid transport system ATP-binding protein